MRRKKVAVTAAVAVTCGVLLAATQGGAFQQIASRLGWRACCASPEHRTQGWYGPFRLSNREALRDAREHQARFPGHMAEIVQWHAWIGNGRQGDRRTGRARQLQKGHVVGVRDSNLSLSKWAWHPVACSVEGAVTYTAAKLGLEWKIAAEIQAARGQQVGSISSLSGSILRNWAYTERKCLLFDRPRETSGGLAEQRGRRTRRSMTNVSLGFAARCRIASNDRPTDRPRRT